MQIYTNKMSSNTKDLTISALKNLLLSDEFEIKSIDVRCASNGLLGFLGKYEKICVKYVISEEEKQANFFVKINSVENEERIAIVEKYKFYEREITMYSKIISKFIKFNDEEKWHPDCYSIHDDTLVFDDISLKGFKMISKRDIFDERYCLVGLKCLARLHASSIILEENESSKRNNIYRLWNDHKDILKQVSYIWDKWYTLGVISALKLAESSEKYGIMTPHFQKVKEKWIDLFKNFTNLFTTYTEETRNVITHNDLWSNNMMFRYEEDVPVQCVFVDFQLSSISPPTADLNSFLYLNLEKELRKEKMNYFQKYYYDEMTYILKHNGININNIYPWNDFVKSCDKFKVWGLIHCIIIYQYVYMNVEDALQLTKDSNFFRQYAYENRLDFLMKYMKEDPRFRKLFLSRIDELISEYIIEES